MKTIDKIKDVIKDIKDDSENKFGIVLAGIDGSAVTLVMGNKNSLRKLVINSMQRSNSLRILMTDCLKEIEETEKLEKIAEDKGGYESLKQIARDMIQLLPEEKKKEALKEFAELEKNDKKLAVLEKRLNALLE